MNAPPPVFEIASTGLSRLWDYGWFDTTTFRVETQRLAERSARELIRAFVRDPLFRRSLCSPEGWGQTWPQHGPWLVDRLDPAWYRGVSFEDAARCLEAVRTHPDFEEPAPPDQWRHVLDWLALRRTDGSMLFYLDVPEEAESAKGKVQVWDFFVELVAVGTALDTLHVGILGAD